MFVLKSWTWRTTLGTFLRALVIFGRVIAEHHGVINTDVAILGGGASGTYAAVRLREDYGKCILLIEKEPILVGFY